MKFSQRLLVDLDDVEEVNSMNTTLTPSVVMMMVMIDAVRCSVACSNRMAIAVVSCFVVMRGSVVVCFPFFVVTITVAGRAAFCVAPGSKIYEGGSKQKQRRFSLRHARPSVLVLYRVLY